MNARKALKIEWENVADRQIVVDGWGGKQTMRIPGALESTNRHRAVMEEMSKKPAQVLRKDGDPETAFKKAARVIERTYTAPYLAHNCMEPVNAFAHVMEDKAELYAPIQAPEFV